MSKKLKVGIIGLGSMGSTHLDIYSKIKGVQVVAVADSIQSRLDGSSKAEGNIVKLYAESKSASILDAVAKLSTIQVETIIETKEVKAASKTIEDFKGVDVLSSFTEVINTMKGVDKKKGKKISALCKDYYEKSGR